MLALVAVVAAILVIGRNNAPPFIARPWMSYRVLYRQTINANGSPSVRYENLSVRRPYEGSDLLSSSRDGSPPVTGAISTETALYDLRQDGTVIFVGGRQPGPPSGDQDIATQLPDLIARDLATDLHSTQHIAGYTCRNIRMFDPPSGPIKKLSGTGEHDDLCITAGGVLLSEQWTLSGRVALARVALAVSRAAGTLPSVAGAVTPAGTDVTATARVTHDPRSFLASPVAPRGYEKQPAIEILAAALNAPPGVPPLASVVWAFADGPRTIFVEAGGPSPQPPWANGDTVTTPVHLAHLGNALTALRSDGAEIRVPLSGNRWVRIRGTVSLRMLERYAQSLRLR